MSDVDRPLSLRLLGVLLVTLALVMLLGHGHSPVAADHAHQGDAVATVPLDAELGVTASDSIPTSATAVAGSATWAVQAARELVVALLVVALVVVLTLTGLPRLAHRSRSFSSDGSARWLSLTPVGRHEVSRV